MNELELIPEPVTTARSELWIVIRTGPEPKRYGPFVGRELAEQVAFAAAEKHRDHTVRVERA